MKQTSYTHGHGKGRMISGLIIVMILLALGTIPNALWACDEPNYIGPGDIGSTKDLKAGSDDKRKSNEPDEKDEDCQTAPTSEPVETTTGGKKEIVTDLSMRGVGFNLSFTRTYRSRHQDNGRMGYNWTHNFNYRLQQELDSAGNIDILLYYPDGYRRRFTTDGMGGWISPSSIYAVLENAGGLFTLTTKSGKIYTFDEQGPLLSVADRYGNRLDYIYETDEAGVFITTIIRGRPDWSNRYVDTAWIPTGAQIVARDFKLLRIEESNSQTTNAPDGRFLALDYFEDGDGDNPGDWKTGRIRRVSDQDNRNVNYDYDASGNLIQVTYPPIEEFPSGQVWTYEYASGTGDGSLEHNLTRIIDGRGNDVKTITYSSDDRVTRQVISEGASAGTFHYEYVIDEAISKDFSIASTIIDRRGQRKTFGNDAATTGLGRNDTITLERDNPGEGPDFVTELYFVNGSGQTASQRRLIKNPRGFTTRFEYDPDGNVTLVRRRITSDTLAGTAADDPLDLQSTFTYNSRTQFFKIKTMTDPRGNTWEYFYDFDEGLLSQDLNGDGQITTRTNGDLYQIKSPQVDDSTGTLVNPITQFQYNNRGQLTRHIDPEGRVIDYLYYDAGPNYGYLQSIVRDPGGLDITTSFTYDLRGNRETLNDGRGFVYVSEYDAVDNIQRSLAPAPFEYEMKFDYDGNNNLIHIERSNFDENNQPQGDGFVSMDFQYDERNRRTQGAREFEDGNFLTTQYAYDRDDNLVEVTLPEGNRITRTFEERNLIAFETIGTGSPDAATTQTIYDLNGNLIQVQDPQDAVDATTKFKYMFYDQFDRLTEIHDEDGTITPGTGNRQLIGYDKNSNVVMEQYFADGVITEPITEAVNEYDPLNRREASIRKLWGEVSGSTIAYANRIDQRSETKYLLNNLPRRMTYPEGNVMEYDYDLANRRTNDLTYENFAGSVIGLEIEYTLDDNSNAITIAKKERDQITASIITYTTTNIFDEINRVTSSTDNSGRQTQLAYDSRHNVLRKTDDNGNTLRRQYDLADRPVQSIEDYRNSSGAITDSTITAMDYDFNSNLIAHIDDHFNVTRYRYDKLDRPTRIEYPDNAQRTLQYNRNSLVTQVTDENGSITVNTYNEKDWLLTQDTTPAAGITGEDHVTYNYDPLYRMTDAENKIGGSGGIRLARCEYSYDSLSRPTQENHGLKGLALRSVGYQYDLNNNMTACLYPGGRQIDYTYDQLDRNDQILESATAIATCSFQGYKNRRADLLNGVECNVNYGSGQEVVSIVDIPSAGPDVVNFAYDHDGVYNRLYEKRNHEGNIGDAYDYDSTYRVTKARYDVANPEIYDFVSDPAADKHDFAYDEVDNRVSVARSGNPTEFYESNFLNQYEEIDTTQGQQATNRTYDANGNLTQDETGRLFTWDYKNRLVQLEDPLTTRASFEYDYRGRRTYKLIETWNGSSWDITAEEYYYCSANEVIEERDGLDIVIRTYVLSARLDKPIQIKEGSNEYYYHYNSLGTVHALTDSVGAVAERYSYDAYGNPTVDIDDPLVSNPYLFTGRRFDSETGLYFYRVRYYDPITGTFLARDPIGYADSNSLYAYVSANSINSIDPFGLRKFNSNDLKELRWWRKYHNEYFEMVRETEQKIAAAQTESEKACLRKKLSKYEKRQEELRLLIRSFVDAVRNAKKKELVMYDPQYGKFIRASEYANTWEIMMLELEVPGVGIFGLDVGMVQITDHNGNRQLFAYVAAEIGMDVGLPGGAPLAPQFSASPSGFDHPQTTMRVPRNVTLSDLKWARTIEAEVTLAFYELGGSLSYLQIKIDDDEDIFVTGFEFDMIGFEGGAGFGPGVLIPIEDSYLMTR